MLSPRRVRTSRTSDRARRSALDAATASRSGPYECVLRNHRDASCARRSAAGCSPASNRRIGARAKGSPHPRPQRRRAQTARPQLGGGPTRQRRHAAMTTPAGRSSLHVRDPTPSIKAGLGASTLGAKPSNSRHQQLRHLVSRTSLRRGGPGAYSSARLLPRLQPQQDIPGSRTTCADDTVASAGQHGLRRQNRFHAPSGGFRSNPRVIHCHSVSTLNGHTIPQG